MQLKVIKADGSIEEYLHTKIIGTISNALSASGHDSTFVAEQLAEAITYYLYNNNSGGHGRQQRNIFDDTGHAFDDRL